MDERFGARLAQLQAALRDFSAALDLDLSKLDDVAADTMRNGQAQKFEFCVELLWKTAKDLLREEHGYDEASPKRVLKRLSDLNYTSRAEYEALSRLLDLRNELSHIYKREMFERIYPEIRGSIGLLKRAAEAMRHEKP